MPVLRRHRHASFALRAFGAAAVLASSAACGGGSGSSPPPTKAHYLSRAASICDSAAAKLNVFERAAPRLLTSFTPAAEKDLRGFVDELQQMVVRLRALPQPQGAAASLTPAYADLARIEADFEDLLHAMEHGTVSGSAAAQGAYAHSFFTDMLAQVQASTQLLDGYGLAACDAFHLGIVTKGPGTTPAESNLSNAVTEASSLYAGDGGAFGRSAAAFATEMAQGQTAITFTGTGPVTQDNVVLADAVDCSASGANCQIAELVAYESVGGTCYYVIVDKDAAFRGTVMGDTLAGAGVYEAARSATGCATSDVLSNWQTNGFPSTG